MERKRASVKQSQFPGSTKAEGALHAGGNALWRHYERGCAKQTQFRKGSGAGDHGPVSRRAAPSPELLSKQTQFSAEGQRSQVLYEKGVVTSGTRAEP